jgi:hypothetical protein
MRLDLPFVRLLFHFRRGSRAAEVTILDAAAWRPRPEGIASTRQIGASGAVPTGRDPAPIDGSREQ